MPHRVNVCFVGRWVADRHIIQAPYMCIGRPAKTRRWIKVRLTLVQRCRWWSNVEPTWIQLILVSAECCCIHASGTDWPYRQTRIPLDNHMQPALFQCWHTAYDAGPTFGQRCRIRPTINDRCTSQQTRAVDPMFFNAGPTSETTGQHLNNFACVTCRIQYWRVPCCASEAGQSTEGQSVLLRTRVTRDVT